MIAHRPTKGMNRDRTCLPAKGRGTPVGIHDAPSETSPAFRATAQGAAA
jgi:hypothetical protein